MAVSILGSFTCAEINLAVPLLLPLLAQFDLALTGPFGLAGLQVDLTAQFNAALSVQLDIGLQISNPISAFQAALQGLVQLEADLALAISFGLPTVSAELSVGLSASLAVTAALALKLGGISALLELALAVKLPLTQFLASLSVGPVFLLAIDQTGGAFTLGDAGGSLQGMFSTGLVDPGNPTVQIQSTDDVYGLVLITKEPSAFAGLQLMLRAA